jgi:hypothetical protein
MEVAIRNKESEITSPPAPKEGWSAVIAGQAGGLKPVRAFPCCIDTNGPTLHALAGRDLGSLL